MDNYESRKKWLHTLEKIVFMPDTKTIYVNNNSIVREYIDNNVIIHYHLERKNNKELYVKYKVFKRIFLGLLEHFVCSFCYIPSTKKFDNFWYKDGDWKRHCESLADKNTRWFLLLYTPEFIQNEYQYGSVFSQNIEIRNANGKPINKQPTVRSLVWIHSAVEKLDDFDCVYGYNITDTVGWIDKIDKDYIEVSNKMQMHQGIDENFQPVNSSRIPMKDISYILMLDEK